MGLKVSKTGLDTSILSLLNIVAHTQMETSYAVAKVDALQSKCETESSFVSSLAKGQPK